MTRSFLRRTCRLLVVGLVLSAPGGAASAQRMLEQIHGLAFTLDGNGIMVPGHADVRVYRAKRWKQLLDTPQKLTGVAVTHDAIFAIRRLAPDMAPQAGGLLKSTDGGRTFRQLLEPGEGDFTFMAAGFRTNAVFLISTAPSTRMPVPGLYHTRDDGKTWQGVAAQGLPPGITSIAVHPLDARTLAIGAPDGLHVSRDAGATFKLLPAGTSVTAVLFDTGGEHVYVAREGVSAVDRVSLDGERSRSLALPISSRDFVTYIAQNPARNHEIAVATHLRSVFVSRNGGGTWRSIARQGQPA